MKKEIKRIAIITNGGDCPGLNSAIKAIVNTAHYKYGWEIYGIINGTNGLFKKTPEYRKLLPQDLNFYETRIAGSILGCMNKGRNPFDYPLTNNGHIMLPAEKENLIPLFKNSIQKLKIDGIIMTGGDGSMFITYKVCKEAGINLIGIPKTIDNDTPITDISIGFSSAINTCVNAIDSLITTARGHQKWMVLEVMGREAGHIALRAGIAGGADIILIPEINYKIENLIKKIKTVKEKEGREFGIIVIAEGILTEELKKYGFLGAGDFIAQKLKEVKIDTRNLVLGHLQRGGYPDAYDRFLATTFGTKAVDSLSNGDQYKMLAFSQGKFIKVDLEEVAKIGIQNVQTNSNKIKLATNMGIYLGEI
jgi:ATP-dependent phosphofructokinase / diphosphate-dependent phosphofructokinase